MQKKRTFTLLGAAVVIIAMVAVMICSRHYKGRRCGETRIASRIKQKPIL